MGIKRAIVFIMSTMVVAFTGLMAASAPRGPACGQEPCDKTDIYYDR